MISGSNFSDFITLDLMYFNVDHSDVNTVLLCHHFPFICRKVENIDFFVCHF